MLQSSVPNKFNIPFANNAGGGYIRAVPQASQIGVQAGAASLYDGFPPQAFTPVGSGGTPPWGQDFNGLLNQVTAWSRWQAAGGPIYYDSTFCTAIGGYPKGAMIQSTTAGTLWISTADNNTTNPDGVGAANWVAVSASTAPILIPCTSHADPFIGLARPSSRRGARTWLSWSN